MLVISSTGSFAQTAIRKPWVLARGDVLAWLLTSACFLNVLSGQWGPATQLGFSVLGAGLALAAMNEPPTEELATSEEAQVDPVEGNTSG